MPDTAQPHYDILIRGGTLVDGTGAPRRAADLAIRGQRIVAVGDLAAAGADLVIDATGKVVAPGFIDSHTHDDRYLIVDPAMPAKLSQGVTTVVTGNCGLSQAPWIPGKRTEVPAPINLLSTDAADFPFATFRAYLENLERHPAAVNAACLVGHTSLRAAAMDDLDRPANDAEIAHMQDLLREAMQAGAIGLSTGTAYPTAMPATTEELMGVAQVLREYGGIYASHIRDEADHIFAALDEAFAVGAAGQAPVLVSHHKLIGPKNHGRSVQTLAHIASAAERQPVRLDAYPYVAGSTILRKDRLAVSSRVIVTKSAPLPQYAGWDLDKIAEDMGVTPEEAVDALQPAGAIYFIMDERDVERILAYPGTMIGSDGMPHDPAPHPRLWGTFPRVLGYYCREMQLFTLEEAVHKMTGMTAGYFGLPGRGVLKPDNYADVVVFDPATIADTATWSSPTRQAQGIDCVLVNGSMAWHDGKSTGSRTGAVVRPRSADW
ncbi:D-aminoacylase [Bordetella genomosp. 10]|uniref:D-aminoacylase n=1 Tax=Bordetella genomosp. 10 TaxID=1416804 RepID=A0A261S0S7_9BORD|nr:D-aminoacylase [Bordetella genomosp. 10]OZI30741.1 D-aminoacylase [Bordetella genomosp. 10]